MPDMRGTLLLGIMALIPASTNYTLQNYDVGNGVGTGSSTNYRLLPAAGSGNSTAGSTSYRLPEGITNSITASVPPAATFTNPDSSYNRLHLTLQATGFASDTRYLIAISSDNFVTTKYVQSDQTTASTLSIANYKTYTGWGGSSGFWILDLQPDTTYQVKVSALQGAFTGSKFGPTSSAATVLPTATFSLATDVGGVPPFVAAFNSLAAGAVTTADALVQIGVTTNAQKGGTITINDTQSGLFSASNSFTLASVTGDLASASSGYGAQVSSTTQGSGGPLTATSPYNGSSNTVGIITTTPQIAGQFSNSITGGVLGISLKAKSAALTPAASDYTDKITVGLQLHF